MRWRPSLAISSLLLLASCSLLTLPFQLVGVIFKALMTLFNAIVNLGSAAASQAVKLSPYALLFASAETTAPSHPDTVLVACENGTSLGSLHTALAAAPNQILTLKEALDSAPQDARNAFLLDPADLLIDSRNKPIQDWMREKKLLSVQWVYASSSSDHLQIDLPR